MRTNTKFNISKTLLAAVCILAFLCTGDADSLPGAPKKSKPAAKQTTAKKNDPKKAEPQDTGETLSIRSDSAVYSMEDEVFTIKGAVTLETPRMKVEGRDLTFNNKSRTGTLDGGPIKITYENHTTATAGRIEVYVEEETARAWGHVTVRNEDGTTTAVLQCESVSLNLKTGDAQARGGVLLDYSDTAAEKKKPKTKDKDAAAKDKNQLELVSSPAHISADSVDYNFKNGKMRVSGSVHAETPDMLLDTKEITGSIKDKVLEASGGLTVKMQPDILVTADHAVIEYGVRRASIDGHVQATRGEDTFGCERVEVDYTKGRRAVRIPGPVNIKMKLKKPPKENPAAGEKTP